jgi:hypothetical protein
MKISTWIKIIAILCIVFGAIGIGGDIISVFILHSAGMQKDGVSEISPELLKTIFPLPYLSLLSNFIYLITGIFFMLKKSFSLKLMYFALTFSIFCRIVPVLLLKQFSPTSLHGYDLSILNLGGPFIDLIMLVGVFRLSGYYFKSKEELRELSSEQRKPLSQQFLKILTIIGLFCISVPSSIQWLWIHSFHSEDSQADSVARFTSYFPSFLRHATDITYLSIGFCIAAIITSIIGLSIPLKFWKWLNIFILVSGILIMLLNLFSLM